MLVEAWVVSNYYLLPSHMDPILRNDDAHTQVENLTPLTRIKSIQGLRWMIVIG